MVANCPFVNRNGEAAVVASEVADATPKTGVTRVGEVAKTTVPVPVSSLSAPDKFAELNVPKEVALPTDVTMPVKFALVVTVVAVAAFPPILRFATGVVELTINGAVPVATVEVNEPVTFKLVPVAAPNAGATKVLLLSVCAFVLNVNSSATLAKSGIVSVVAPTV